MSDNYKNLSISLIKQQCGSLANSLLPSKSSIMISKCPNQLSIHLAFHSTQQIMAQEKPRKLPLHADQFPIADLSRSITTLDNKLNLPCSHSSPHPLCTIPFLPPHNAPPLQSNLHCSPVIQLPSDWKYIHGTEKGKSQSRSRSQSQSQ